VEFRIQMLTKLNFESGLSEVVAEAKNYGTARPQGWRAEKNGG